MVFVGTHRRCMKSNLIAPIDINASDKAVFSQNKTCLSVCLLSRGPREEFFQSTCPIDEGVGDEGNDGRRVKEGELVTKFTNLNK